MFISIFYMFRANMCSSSGESIVSIIWYMSLYVGDRLVCRNGRNSIHTCIPDGHLHRVTYTRCRIETIDSPNDEQMVARIIVVYRNKHIRKRIVHEVDYLQELLPCVCWTVLMKVFKGVKAVCWPTLPCIIRSDLVWCKSTYHILDFKLSPCSECCMLSSG